MMSAWGDLIHYLALQVYLESFMIYGSKGLNNGNLNGGLKVAPAAPRKVWALAV